MNDIYRAGAWKSVARDVTAGACPAAHATPIGAIDGRLAAAMGGAVGKHEGQRAVWPPGWLEIPEGPRLIARNAILDISSMPPSQFVQLAGEPYCISADAWDFSEYHAAAAAAVQEDSKLNKLTYACVPRRLSESDFWRLYFSKVLYVLDSVKTHGTFPPPAPSKQAQPPRAPLPPPGDESSCLVQ